jgi:hypothetical protein
MIREVKKALQEIPSRLERAEGCIEEEAAEVDHIGRASARLGEVGEGGAGEAGAPRVGKTSFEKYFERGAGD